MDSERLTDKRLDAIEARAINGEGAFAVTQMRVDVLALLAELDRLRIGLSDIAGRHDGHDSECPRCEAHSLLTSR